jgi:hypothetical protein
MLEAKGLKLTTSTSRPRKPLSTNINQHIKGIDVVGEKGDGFLLKTMKLSSIASHFRHKNHPTKLLYF